MAQHRLTIALAGSVCLTALLSLQTGSQAIPLFQALREGLNDSTGVYGLILTELRIPRTLVALLADVPLSIDQQSSFATA
jgi:iron complex transport system permease protein